MVKHKEKTKMQIKSFTGKLKLRSLAFGIIIRYKFSISSYKNSKVIYLIIASENYIRVEV